MFIAAFVWLMFWVPGVFIAAQGQILKSNVDAYVNTSPFLADSQRAQIMSLA